MRPWQLLDRDTIPGTTRELCLYQRGDEFSIKIAGGGELMNSRVHGSEDALAELACQAFEGGVDRVLIGGLGMGFTLAAALSQVGPEAKVTVAELVPAVVRWNRGPLGVFAGHPLDDSRTEVHEGDVARLLKKARESYAVILLDVDNGPEGLTRKENDWLYGRAGLDAAYRALRPGGCLGVWSAGAAPEFTERLRRAGFEVETHQVRAHRPGKGARHVVWLGRRLSP